MYGIQYLCIIEHGTVKLFNFYFKKDAPNIVKAVLLKFSATCLKFLAVRLKIYMCYQTQI